MQSQYRFILLLSLSSLLVLSACNSSSSGDAFIGTGGMIGSGGTGAGVGTGGTGAGVGTGGTGAGVGTGGASGNCSIILCDGKSMVCGDCLDNDGDGLVDDNDPECLGPCDNTEGDVLLAGVPGEDGNTCGADCYFDVGNGSGSGECKWDRRCDPLEPKVDPSGANPQCLYDPALIDNENYCPEIQPEGCEDSCGPLTPNGCDCFGCCTFPELVGMGPQGTDGYIFLGSETKADGGTCTLAEVTNPERCFPCTPAGNCLNTCEKCELCLGKTELPPECFPGSGGSSGSGGSGGMGGSDGGERCPVDKEPCGLPGDAECAGFCLTGCCIVVQ